MIRNLFTAVCILVSGFVPLAVQSQNFAREFIENQKDKSKTEVVYVDFVDEILHTNTTLSMMEGFDELDAETKDLLTKKYTIVSDKVNDSILLSVFKTKLLSTLNSFGFDVRECKADSFPQTLQPNEHTLQVAQFELEEFVVNDTIAAKDNNQTISYTKLLSGIRWNTWLKYNTSDTNTCLIFFADDETTDDFFGFIEKTGGQYYADYTLTKINPNDAYLLAHSNAELCGRYFFNFLMNRYVWLKTSGNPPMYYSIGRQGNLISDDKPFDNFDVIQ